MKRFLCSDLVVLRTGDRERFVNLEEIWRTGAVLECEEEVMPGATGQEPASLLLYPAALDKASAPQLRLSIAIDSAEKHESGWRVEVRFLEVEWTPELYTPAHLTDMESIGRAAERARSAR